MKLLEERVRYLRTLYEENGVACYLWQSEHEKFQVFEIRDFDMQKQLVMQLLQSDECYFLKGRFLYYIRDYEEGLPLKEWLQQSHSLQECRELCEDLLFELMQQPLPQPLLATSVHVKSIAINHHHQTLLFRHPFFHQLQEQPSSFYQECGELCYQILSSSIQMRRWCFKRKPIWKKFLYHREQGAFHNYECLVDDIVALRALDQKTQIDTTLIKKLATYILLLLVMMGFGTLVYIKGMEYLHQTYERLPSIGTQSTRL